MNRELKFQILDKLNRNEELLINNLGKIFVIDQGCGQSNEADDQENYIIRQYIGLKDKNGKEIYDGDIVSFQYRDEGLFNGVIGLDDMYLGYSVQNSKAFFGSMQITYYNTEELNVIGNIFENPELIKSNE